MAYIPNATDATQPTDNIDASTAAAEFRTLKGYIQGLVLAAGMFSPVRQCANDGFVNSIGDPAFLIAAVAGGQALDLKATGRPIVVNFAGGSTGTGINDRNSTLTADAANVITAMPASNTSYIYADYVNAASWNWGQTLAPVQYGKVYPQNAGIVMQFAGAAGATTFLDDFGNTWTAQGGAKVQTDQFKFGTGGLGGAGATNTLNGAADFIKCASFSSLGPTAWSMRAWVRPTVLPGAGNSGEIFAITNAAAFGARLMIYNNAGTIKFAYSLSSNGVATDIAALVQGTTTPVINTWYFVELTFDTVGAVGTYRLYVGGLQEASTVTTARVCGTTIAALGARPDGFANTFFAGYIDKPEFLSYCNHPAGTAYAVPTAAPSLATAGYAPDAFDTQAMKMYSVTGPSTAAGSPPATTQKYRCYLAEVTTGIAVPSGVQNYAYNGQWESPFTTAVSGQPVWLHNLGVTPLRSRLAFRNKNTDGAVALSGDEFDYSAATAAAPGANGMTLWHRKNVSYANMSSANFYIQTGVGAVLAVVYTNYNFKLTVWRGWGGA